MSPLNICAAWRTVCYQATSQESNFLKKTLFIVFGVKLRILLYFPVGGFTYLFSDLALGIGRILLHIKVLSCGIMLALSIKNKQVF